ncbi:hypothetical protein MCAG_00915 [Micromonospora sp. ATCC 39149]|uniref:CBS domain-containing protein n=1 Tax=Micromonospora carbonacea TaxID=47853 RepID=A0A7D6C9K5_9ACTN|nr:hypothetical protein [Micromonospora sp. ATCC 39149]EEP70588.1 hypothetical protein MCAG_00915 [Micromonospora sp. ATCC 39149]QLJ96962.1 hypothetical protein HZU44_19020 [Micromonospora carbonacea]
MSLTARDLMCTDHCVVETDSAPPDRADELTLGVDERGTPRWVVGPGGRGPALLVAASTPVDELLTSNALVRLLDEHLPALVVVDDSGRPVGVVPAEALGEQLLRQLDGDKWAAYGTDVLAPPDPGVMGDPLLAGRLRPPTAPIRIFCAYCGALNHLDEFPEPDRDCAAGGHRLEPDWR